MTKNISASSFGKGGVALALGAALLAAAMPAQAQWLVQDNNLYNLIKEGVVDKIAISGKNVGPYSTEGEVNDNTSTFNQLVFPLSPNTLLDPDKRKSDVEEQLMLGRRGEKGVGGKLARLRRTLIQLRRLIWPQRDVLNTLEIEDLSFFSPRDRVRLREALDDWLGRSSVAFPADTLGL